METFDYKFTKVNHLSSVSDEEDLLIWVFHVDKTPPHIGISTQGVFFSLKSNGQDKIPVDKVSYMVKNKNIKLIKLKLNIRLSVALVEHVFNSFTSATSARCSCLSPIKKVLDVPNEIPKLSDLLIYLDGAKKISGWSAQNVSVEEAGIKSYAVSDIEKRLNFLNA
jgi:hypothetical protein